MAAEGAAEEIEMATSNSGPAAAAQAQAGLLTKDRAEALRAAFIAAIIGGGLIFLTGFAHSQTIHNGAHDTRHGLSFPCH